MAKPNALATLGVATLAAAVPTTAATAATIVKPAQAGVAATALAQAQGVTLGETVDEHSPVNAGNFVTSAGLNPNFSILLLFNTFASGKVTHIDLVGQGPGGINAPFSGIVNIFQANGNRPGSLFSSQNVTYNPTGLRFGQFGSATATLGTPVNLPENAYYVEFSGNGTVLGVFDGAVGDTLSRNFGNIEPAFTGLGSLVVRFRDATPVASAVPEPSTWAMMILGLGAVGAAARRKKAAGYNLKVSYDPKPIGPAIA